MILKIYNQYHSYVGMIKQYADFKITEEQKEKTLSVKVRESDVEIKNEYYIQTDEGEYVVKEAPSQTNSDPTIVAIMNLEGLEQIMFESFIKQNVSIEAAAREALIGTGWSLGACRVEIKNRNVGMVQCNARQVLINLATAFLCEIKFDTLNKQVAFFTQRGSDRGAYFISGLNLRELSVKCSSYDYYTQIIPYGKDGLDITSVNSGKNYLENYQYSNKIRPYIWKDDSYTDAQALKEDAELMLNDLSKPEKAYSAKIYDLSRNAVNTKEYSHLAFEWGDVISLVDSDLKVKDKQRIMKITRYPEEPEKDTIEIANVMLSFEEMQSRYKAAMEIVNFAINSSGQVNTNSISVSEILATEDFTDWEVDFTENLPGAIGGAVLDKIYWPGTEEINGSLLYEYSIAAEKISVGNGGNLYYTYDTFEQVTNRILSYAQTGCRATIAKTTAWVGNKCCRIVPTAANCRAYLGTEPGYGNVEVIYDNYYIASAYIKADRKMHAGIAVIQRDGGRVDAEEEKHYIEVNTDWRRIEFPVKANHRFLSIALIVQEASGTVYFDGIMIELIMSERQSASPFKVGGTSTITGDNIITGAIVSRDYDGTDGDIDNEHGSVINLDGLGMNFGNRLIYDQVNDILKIIGDIEAESFKSVKEDTEILMTNNGLTIRDKKINSYGGIGVTSSTFWTDLRRNSLNFGIQGKSPSHECNMTYGEDEVLNINKPITFNIPSNGRQAVPVGSWTNSSSGNAIATIGVDSNGNLMIYGNFNGDGKTYETRYVATSKSKPL